MKFLNVFLLILIVFSCKKQEQSKALVSNAQQLVKAISEAKPGNKLVLKNGTYN